MGGNRAVQNHEGRNVNGNWPEDSGRARFGELGIVTFDKFAWLVQGKVPTSSSTMATQTVRTLYCLAWGPRVLSSGGNRARFSVFRMSLEIGSLGGRGHGKNGISDAGVTRGQACEMVSTNVTGRKTECGRSDVFCWKAADDG